MKKLLLFALFILPAGATTTTAHAAPKDAVPGKETVTQVGKDDIQIGVAAFADPLAVEDRWQPTADYLAKQLRQPVSLKVLPPDELEDAVAREEVDFLISNAITTVAFKKDYGISQLLTLVGTQTASPEHSVGSAIIARSNAVPTDWQELRHRKIISSSPEAFGGYQIFVGELAQHGMDVKRDLLQFSFEGFPQEDLLKQVYQGRADIAVLPACVLETAEARGDIPKGALQVALTKPTEQLQSDFPCAVSTLLYPGYALSKLGHTDHLVASSVVKALLALDEADSASQLGRYRHWTVPVDDRQVFALLKTLQQWPFVTNWDKLLHTALPWLLGGGILLLLGGLHHLWVQRLVGIRTRALQAEMQLHKQTQQALLDQQKQFYKAQRVLLTGEMASGISHELKQPLAGIRYLTQGCLYRLQDSETPLSGALTKVLNQVDRAQETINRLREFCHRDSERCRCDLRTLLDETLNLMQPDFKRLKLVPRVNTVQALVDVDPVLIQQVLVNLIRNSLDAMEQVAEPALVLELSVNNKWAQLAITDNGKGLTREQHERLFMPFETSKPKGTGLGMVICKRIVEEHQGLLEARPLTPGLCITVSLPSCNQHECNKQNEHSYQQENER
ncbi:sensor histidine kinase [Shewanella sp. GXUN23E]|uniref:sensor histidine kinase n=1 Tax=Shewanella sp. GXUN23E TaxID=3422498 RepID=UPI003D7F02C3